MEDHHPPELQPHELAFLAWFLDDAGASFERHTADEMFSEANAGTLAVAAAIREEFGDDAPEEYTCRLHDDGPEMVQFYISQAMRFFADRCRRLAAAEDEPVLGRAELDLLAELSALAAEDHERVAHEVCFDLSLDLTPENRKLFVLAADTCLARGPLGQALDATAAGVRAAVLDEQAQTVDIPDYWVMFALSRRCRELAARG